MLTRVAGIVDIDCINVSGGSGDLDVDKEWIVVLVRLFVGLVVPKAWVGAVIGGSEDSV